MKTIIRLNGLTILLVALLFSVPGANAASISKSAPVGTVAAEEVDAKSDAPKAVAPQPSVQSIKKGTAPKLKPMVLPQPQKSVVGRPMQDPNAAGVGEEIPIPNDSEVGISMPGSTQSSLTVGSSGDKHEQEADDVADSVIGNPKPKTARGLSPGVEVGKKPDVDPGGPVFNLGTPGAAVGLDPRDDPSGPVYGGQ